jgi:hypothetical protein
MGVFASTPPIPQRGWVRVTAIRPTWAMWKGLSLDMWAVVACIWRGAWWQGVLLAPPSTDRGVQAWTIRPCGFKACGFERRDNFKIKFQIYSTYSIEISRQG